MGRTRSEWHAGHLSSGAFDRSGFVEVFDLRTADGRFEVLIGRLFGILARIPVLARTIRPADYGSWVWLTRLPKPAGTSPKGVIHDASYASTPRERTPVRADESAEPCPHDCPDTCAMLVTVVDGRALEVRGDPEHPFTRGALCVESSDYVEARLLATSAYCIRYGALAPRGAAAFERIGWDAALDEI